jgi:hypothetical protein
LLAFLFVSKIGGAMNMPLFLGRSLLIVLGIVFGSSAVGRSSKPQSDVDFLAGQQKRFANYQHDFVDFSRTQTGTIEFELLTDLGYVASVNAERTDSIRTLIEIYGATTCKPDQSMVQAHLKDQLDYYLKITDFDLRSINSDLANTRLPAISQTAINMKNDLRDLRTKFAAIKNRE